MMHDKCDEIQARIEPTVEWDEAREAVAKLQAMLSEGMAYLSNGSRRKNVYSRIAWLRLCRLLSTLTAGMVCMRLVSEGKSNREIQQMTGLSIASIAAYKGWNTMYSCVVEDLLAPKGKTEEQRERDLESLASIGVCR
jgi:uncharacterized protein YerC